MDKEVGIGISIGIGVGIVLGVGICIAICVGVGIESATKPQNQHYRPLEIPRHLKKIKKNMDAF
jgi:hypothetical protein